MTFLAVICDICQYCNATIHSKHGVKTLLIHTTLAHGLQMGHVTYKLLRGVPLGNQLTLHYSPLYEHCPQCNNLNDKIKT